MRVSLIFSDFAWVFCIGIREKNINIYIYMLSKSLAKPFHSDLGPCVSFLHKGKRRQRLPQIISSLKI